MILVKNSKRLFPAYFSVLEISFLSSDDVVFPKGGFFDDINVILLKSKNLHFSKEVNKLFWSNIIFQTSFEHFFFCKRDLGFVV